jgi:uncharacterized protein (TIGR02145 family)
MKRNIIFGILLCLFCGSSAVGQNTQTIALPAGWSMFSTFLQPNQPNIGQIVSAISSQVNIIKNGTGQVFWPQFSVNQIGEIEPGEGFQIKLSTAQNLQITGNALVPENHPLIAPAGWSLLGYIRVHASLADSVLADLANHLIILKDYQGSVYWPAMNIKQISFLQPGRAYQFKMSTQDTLVYAPNSFACGTDLPMDYDLNFYPTITINAQCWMRDNLKTTRYKNGVSIVAGSSVTTWTNNYTGAYVWNNNSIANKPIYGGLYNWYAVSNSNGLCPEGWHVPTDGEWSTLSDFLGGQSLAGGALKETGTSHWQTPNTDATNSSGFTALPGGNRSGLGAFTLPGSFGYYWSATESSSVNAWYRVLYHNSGWINRSSNGKAVGYSIRCVKDLAPTGFQ